MLNNFLHWVTERAAVLVEYPAISIGVTLVAFAGAGVTAYLNRRDAR